MNKVLVVTGGSRGIGAEAAKLGAARGYSVCINYNRNREAAEVLVDQIRVAGGEALAVQADISREAEVLRLFRTVDDELGTVTALVNNAGILDRQIRVEETDEARLQRIFAVNV